MKIKCWVCKTCATNRCISIVENGIETEPKSCHFNCYNNPDWVKGYVTPEEHVKIKRIDYID